MLLPLDQQISTMSYKVWQKVQLPTVSEYTLLSPNNNMLAWHM